MALDRARLSKLCEMLASDSDGERANAARLATRMIKDAGLTWTAVISNGPQSAHTHQQSYHRHEKAYRDPQYSRDHDDRWKPSEHEAECIELSKLKAILTDWETNFLRDITYWKFLTEKQLGALNRIREKAKNYRAAQAHSAKAAQNTQNEDDEIPF